MKFKKVTVFGVLGIMLISFNSVTLASSAGTSADPVVTKSYLDLRLEEALKSVSAGGQSSGSVSTDLTQSDIDKIAAAVLLNMGTSTTTSGSQKFKPMQVSAGSYLIGREGTEIILRGGSALAVTDNINGISDLTDGKDIFNGTKANYDHLYVIPRDDGRGFFCSANSWFMVKGDVYIK